MIKFSRIKANLKCFDLGHNIQTCSVKTALLPVYEANDHSSIGPSRCSNTSLTSFVQVLKVTLDISKNVLYIVAIHGAPRMLAVKVFVIS